MHWQIHKDGRADYLAADGRLEVAVALGLDPVTRVLRVARRCRSTSTSSCSPASCKGEPVELVQAKTVDLEVPANAEIVLEGYVERGDVGARGAVRRPHRLLLAAPSRSRSST